MAFFIKYILALSAILWVKKPPKEDKVFIFMKICLAAFLITLAIEYK